MKTEKEKMDIRSSRSNSMLVPGTGEPEEFLHHSKDTKSYARAQGDMSNTDTPAGPSN